MKTYLRIFVLLASAIFFFTSCEKEITIKLPQEPKKLVVEGWIENGKPPKVILTKSSGYFDPIDSSALYGSIVTNAIVTVFDGITTEQLTASIDLNFFPPFYYKGSTIIGEIGKTYTLSIDVDGQNYTATTTIPETVKWDILWFELNPDNDSIGNVYGSATDDGNVYNYYRAYTKILHFDNDFVPIFGSVWDDKFFSGQTLTAQLYHGVSSNIIAPNPDKSRGIGYKLGDTVITRLSTMNYESYKFWEAAESEIYSGGNPFSSSTTVPTTISNGALGCWTGYGSTYDTIVCK
jgi:hypothetical protein